MQEVDLESVVEIEAGANAFPWSLQQIQESLFLSTGSLSSTAQGCYESPVKHECWVCCVGGGNVTDEIVAYAIVASVLDESDLLNLCVSAAHQGQGYGRKFLDFLLKNARKDDRQTVFLEVRAENKAAIHLYESTAFKRISVRKAYYRGADGREDALIYSLAVGQG